MYVISVCVGGPSSLESTSGRVITNVNVSNTFTIIIINGSNTNIQETVLYPFTHKKFKNHVHNNAKNNFDNINIGNTFIENANSMLNIESIK